MITTRTRRDPPVDFRAPLHLVQPPLNTETARLERVRRDRLATRLAGLVALTALLAVETGLGHWPSWSVGAAWVLVGQELARILPWRRA